MNIKGFLPCLLLFGMLITISSCGDDDPANSFTYNGNTYELTAGYLSDVGGNLNNTHDFDVFLVSSGISTTGSVFTGMGELIYLDLNTSSSAGLETGTYNWSSARDAFTVVPGSELFLEYDLSDLSGQQIRFMSGTVNVTVNGSEYTIDFNMESNGSTIAGSYTGPLQNI